MLYEVRWSRSQKGFAWVDEGSGVEVVCKETDGLATVMGTDDEQGRLHLEVDEIVVDGELLIAVQDVDHVVVPEGAFKMEAAGRWRICYRRAANDWRMRDEDGSGKVTMVRSIRGQMRIAWHDHQAHLFHIGDSWFFEGLAYLVPQGS